MDSDKKKILFADDDPEIREVVRILLESEGYEVVEATNGNEAVSMADSSIDLVILDVMMPGCSGVTACAEIRKNSTVPILFLTAKTQDSDKTVGFSAGGDDYLAKPFSYSELIARVKAMLRRYYVYCGKQTTEDREKLQVKDLQIDTGINEVRKNGTKIALTDLEYRILYLLASNRKKIFTIQNIYESVWNEPYFYNSNNTVMVHIRNLRKKLEDDPQNPKYITNVWGKGYRIE
ncbi:response regulator transcription factor [Anaerovorax odorimutans]|uniref:Stage 0 sporulation protein A homolog n=1 Tax=Anaerovorax odorimutans TaxID=109327 RepID=A0ABT1RMW9_9FIRM|nr:response regulator transcription factor [Anaerovorax odorimutans]MCQ4636522.1 response regulator transcription factor [Anaerovorax odorimutans]